ncbi:unnamed protein product, partial [Tilletia caries]
MQAASEEEQRKRQYFIECRDGLLADLSTQLQEKATEMQNGLKEHIDAALNDYHEAAKTFTAAHQVVDLDDVDHSQVKDGKIVLVLNDIQLDEVQHALRRHREAEGRIEELEREMNALRTKLEEQRREQRQQPAQRTQSRQLPEFTDEEDLESGPVRDADRSPPRKRSRSRKVVGPGRPDAKIQEAFEELVREGFGIDPDEPWPDYPSISRNSPEWPRYPPTAKPIRSENPDDSEEDDADEEGELMDRLDWVGGRMDDAEFRSILRKHAKTLTDEADAYRLPPKEQMREYDYIYRACARTLENIKRTCRERKQKDAATLLSKKETKGR